MRSLRPASLAVTSLLALAALSGCSMAPEWVSAVGRSDDGELVAVVLRCPGGDPLGDVVLVDRAAYDQAESADDDAGLGGATLITWTGLAAAEGEAIQFALLGTPAPPYGVEIEVRSDTLAPGVSYSLGVPTLHP